MQGFQDFLVEDKNTHLEHLEDEIINNGTKGARTAINFLKSVKEMLQGGKGGSTVTVKWDGAPAIFCGINPENGKFFVGTKSIFNKSPKINYTNADVSRNHGGQLADKLKVALKYEGPVEAPINKDQVLAKLKIIYDDELIDEYELLALEEVKKVNIFSRLLKSLNYLIWGDV